MLGRMLPGASPLGADPRAEVTDQTGIVYRPPVELLTLTQRVAQYITPAEFATLAQYVGVLTPPNEYLSLDQRVIEYALIPPAEFATISQSVRRYTPPAEFMQLRQIVGTDGTLQALHQRTEVELDGVDISATVSLDINISAAEGQNNTAQFRFKPSQGPIDIPALQNRPVKIRRWLDGQLVTLFSGWIDTPTYDYQQRRMICQCSDLRDERLGKEDQDELKQLTGGVYNSTVLREDASGREWVRELMRTVAGSLQYDASGLLHYAAWGIGTPRHTLTNPNVKRRDLSVQFAVRSQIINKQTVTVEYRYERQRARQQSVYAGISDSAFFAGTARAPSKEALLSATESVNNWTRISYSMDDLPGPGWYIDGNGNRVYFTPYTRNTSSTYKNVDGVQVKTGRSSSSTDARDISALGITADLVRHISQPITERYELTITAPESVDQYGEVEGSNQQHALEIETDTSAWEDATPSSWPPSGFTLSAAGDYIRYVDDRRSDLESALQAAWSIAHRGMLEAHRRNYVDYIHQSSTPGEGILPLRIGDTISLNTNVIVCTGQVTSYEHVLGNGIYETRVRLALNGVFSDVTTSTNWSLPAAPAVPEQSRNAPSVVNGTIEDGVVTITLPEIAEVYVDEIEAVHTGSYTVQIPRGPITVNVTAYNE